MFGLVLWLGHGSGQDVEDLDDNVEVTSVFGSPPPEPHIPPSQLKAPMLL